MGSGERHHRMGHGRIRPLRFNAAAYLAAHDRDYSMARAAVFPASALPAWFRLRHPQRGDRDAPDLRGKRLGGPTSSPPAMCGCVAFRRAHYGAPHREITWLVEREMPSRSRRRGLRYERLPDGVRAER